MKKCIEIANKGIGNVSPNPLVGSLIVYEGNIIGKGYHEKYGYAHAEVNAINSVKDKSILKKSTLYVNLEPCNHFGKTPPCTDIIIKNNIPKVVIGCLDSYSKVKGKGIERLKKNGVKVIYGVLNKESRNLNKRFLTFHEKKRPYIILKWAQSIDGYIAPKVQNSPFWMTSKESKLLVHKWRAEEDSILVGRKTAEKDNPFLTVREIKGKNPIRIILDKNLRLKKSINLFNNDSKTIIFNNIKNEKIGSNIYIKICFKDLIKSILLHLYELKVHSVIIEGGSTTLQSFINENLWDEARIFKTNKKINDGIKAVKIDKEINYEKINKNDSLSIIFNK